MRHFILLLAFPFLLFSCVSQKKYDELLKDKVAMTAEQAVLQKNLDDANNELAKVNAANETTQAKNASLTEEVAEMNDKNAQLQKLYDELEATNNRLTEDYKNLLESSTAKSSELSKTLAEKEKALLDLEQSLLENQKKMDTLMLDLQARERKVQELQNIIQRKDSSVLAMKNSVSQALLAFEGSDLNVEVKNGKVYVSLASKLLFKTGSVNVDSKGAEALRKLGEVVKDQEDFEIMVEGHTDDVPISKSSKYLQDNWDLSVLRATAVTRILRESGVQPERITAAGRGPFHPMELGSTQEARQKNRRTEIILTPNLDELYQVINTEEPQE